MISWRSSFKNKQGNIFDMLTFALVLFIFLLVAVVAVAFTYLIARRFLSERLSLFAVGLLSLSTVFMLVGSANRLDVRWVAFGLAGGLFAL